MKVLKIQPEILNAAVAMLSPWVEGLTSAALTAALENYDTTPEAKTPVLPEKPLTRFEVAELLGVSVQTIARMLDSGVLTRIHVTGSRGRAVRISAESVRLLMTEGAK